VFAAVLAGAASFALNLPDLYKATAMVVVERQVAETFVRPAVTGELESRLHVIKQEILSRDRLSAIVCGTHGQRSRRYLRVPPPPAQAAFLASACEASLTSDLAGFGIVTLRTPLDMAAWTLDGSMPGGNCSTRMNTP